MKNLKKINGVFKYDSKRLNRRNTWKTSYPPTKC